MNETMQFLRQFSRQREEGYTVYRGEDAFPLAAPGVQAVADGLGGSGAISHSHVHPDAFCRDRVGSRMLDKLLHDGRFFTIIAPILKESGWDHGLDDYIFSWAGRDFFELAAVREHYEMKNWKKSAYFGSRVAMVLMRILNQAVDKDKLFDLAQSREGLAVLEQMLSNYFQYGMQAAARALELRYESEIPKLSLLGTTLCGGFVRDCGDAVEALYLLSGDSQAYVLNGEGLALACGIHNRGMHHHLNISDPEKARIHCTLRRFPKPCMLLCATDGCFDAALFRRTPLAFELALLGAVARSEGMDQLSRFLTEFFDTYGRHDDAASMAACLYGMDYSDLRQLALRRVQTLYRLYPELEERMDLLCVDYAKQYRQQLRQLEQLLKNGWSQATAGMEEACLSCLHKGSPAAESPEEKALGLEASLDCYLARPCPELEPWARKLLELRQKLRQCRQETQSARQNLEVQTRIAESYAISFTRYERDAESEG